MQGLGTHPTDCVERKVRCLAMNDLSPDSAARASALLAGQNHVLRLVATGEPLGHVLDELIRFMEAQSGEAICSVLLLDEDGKSLHWGAAPSLPEAFSRAVEGVPIERRAVVIVTDIEHDPLWKDVRDVALSFGLKACTWTPILDAHGNALGTFAFYYRTPRAPSPLDLELIDISRDLAAIAIERSRSTARLEEAVRARDTFLAIASHELRTPITTLLLQTKALKLLARHEGGVVPIEKLSGKLENLIRQTRRLDRLVAELLDVSHLVSGRMVVAHAPVDLVAVARDVTTALAESFALERTPLVLEADGPVLALGDRGRIEQVLENLLSNALKFGSGRPTEVRIERRNGRALATVHDHGIGIAPEDQTRIFQKFERVVSARHYSGFGLGLWLSRELVEKMGGRIEVESKIGAGSTFTMELEAA